MRKLVYLLAGMLCSAVAMAQVPGTGAYAFATFDNPGFDSINLGNLNTRFSIPIVSRPGRGLPFNYTIQYEGMVWQPVVSGSTTTWTPDATWGFGGLLNGTSFAGYLTYSQLSRSCPRPPHYSGPVPGAINYNNYRYHDAYGAVHHFNYSVVGICPLTDDGGPQVSGDGSTNDGSGYSLVNGYQVMTRSGTLITPASSPTGQDATSITDANGNQINATGSGSFTDTLGVTALSISGSNPRIFAYPVILQANGSTSASATITYRTYTVRTNFQCSGITEYGSNAADLVDRITLADGSFYAFAYETTANANDGAVTARLQSITLPTGGTISYTYSQGCGAGINADGTPGSVTRTTTDGSRTYARSSIGGTGNGTSTTLTDEGGNQTLYQFTNTGGFFYQTHRQSYQGQVSTSSAALIDSASCYNGMQSSCDGAAVTLPITEIVTQNVSNGIGGTTTDNVYSVSGLLTSSTQKDGTTVLASSTTTYNALGEIQQTSTYDGSGTVVTTSTFEYDEGSVTTTTGIPQHGSVSAQRGNLTSSHVTTGNGSLDTTITYYDTGAPLATTTPNGQTQYSYDPTQTFVTQTTLPTPSSGVSLATSASYDPQSGAQLSASGMNAGQTTQITHYDPLLRPTAISKPNGGQTSYQYSPNAVGIVETIDASGATSQLQTAYDSYGRVSRTARYNGQSSNAWYQVDYCYNALGELQFQSTPYQGSGLGTQIQCSGNGTAYVYDALGRVTSSTTPDGTSSSQYVDRSVKSTSVNGVQKITQYDLLGRLAGVCEISSNINLPNSGAPTDCGMEIAGSGFLTTYTYDLANHQMTAHQGVQLRVFQTDAAGRLTATSEPERGNTSYAYAYNNTGLLVTRTRPRANQSSASVLTHTATQYDSLGRLVSINYDDGLTPSKSYYYDGNVGWTNFNQTNVKGAMGLALSGTSGGGTTFSYGIMGQVLTMDECLPSGCGNPAYDHLQSFTYDYVGNLTSQSDPISGTISYGHSPAGEVTSIVNQTFADQYNPANLVSNVGNGANGPVTFTYGNGLSQYDLYSWTGMLQGAWVCPQTPSYGCASEVYGYNALRTGSQVYLNADTVNPQNTFGYDEFNRLISSNYQYQQKSSAVVGYDPNNYTYSPKTFSYVYDRYGNRTQQNAPQGGPAPSYNINAYTNQITGSAYDAAGNLSDDGIGDSYQYDAEGNVITVSGSYPAQYTYDALNRRVRVQSGSSTFEYLYDVAGHRISTWYAGTNTGIEGRIYWGDRLLAFRSNDGRTYFDHQDNAGTERVRTAYDGSIANTFPSTSLPYDDAYTSTAPGTASDLDNLHFAELERDAPTSRHAQFRQYSNIEGRWMSPDPYDGSYDFTNPQSLNRYAYVGNNPLGFTDPSGLVRPPTLPDNGGGGGGCIGTTYTFGATWDDGEGGTGGGDQGSIFQPGWCSGGLGFGAGISPIIMPPIPRGPNRNSPPGAAAPSNPAQPTACQVKTLNAINSQFGTNLTAASILPTSDPNPTAGGGQINTNFGVVSGLSPAQFNAIHSGRFAPSGVFGFITGYGSSLHVVAGPSGLDPSANLFGASNIGGMYSAGFTAHFDSAWAYNPFGALLHYLIDVRGQGSHRQPCP